MKFLKKRKTKVNTTNLDWCRELKKTRFLQENLLSNRTQLLDLRLRKLGLLPQFSPQFQKPVYYTTQCILLHFILYVSIPYTKKKKKTILIFGKTKRFSSVSLEWVFAADGNLSRTEKTMKISAESNAIKICFYIQVACQTLGLLYG